MTSSVASRPGFLRWLVTAGDPATLVATFSTAAGSPVNLSGSTVAAACANWSTSHAGSATVGGASNNEVTVAFTDTITGQLTGGGWTWTLTVDGVTTLAGPLDVAQPGVAGVTGGDASAVVVVDDVNVAVTVTTAGGGGVTVHNDLTGRSDPDTHPISSITGLSAALAAAGNVDSVNGQTGTVSLDLDDLTDVDTTTDPPDADDVLAWDGVTWTPATLTALGAPGLSNATPADLGTAAPGVSTEASRADHVHDLPTAADVGAAASLHVHSGADITSGTVATARLGSGTADSTTFLRGDSTWAHPMVRELPLSSGSFVALPAAGVGTVGANGAAGRLYLIPIWLPAGTYDRVGVATTAAGTATWRLGAYKADPSTLMPDGTALVQEFGTINLSVSPGNLLITTTFTVPTSALYWMAVLVDSYSSAPSVSGWHAGYALPPPVPWMPHTVYETPIGRSTWLRNVYSGAPTGAVPATCPTTGWADTGPQVRLRVA